MKRSTVAVLSLLALLLPAALAVADQTASHLVQKQVLFRTHDLYVTLYSRDPARAKRLSGTSGYIDSALYVRSGSAVADTSAPISLMGLAQPQQLAGAVGPDTTMLGRLIISEAAGAAESGLSAQVLKGLDSIYVTIEVSGGGPMPRWTRVATLLPMVYAVADTSTGRVATYKLSNLAATSNSVTMLGLRGWSLIRFIITNDYNTATHCFAATWNYYSSDVQDNK